MKACKNNCIFCFIKQLPEGLRQSLYIKDDDFIESFTHGNFITLTNLNKKEIDNIVKYKIEPLQISLHSFDKKVRNILFGNKKNYEAVKIFKFLDRNAVRTNIQIVLCPGINDGSDLVNTLDILTSIFNSVLSVGIVPVGITKYNKCSLLKSFDSALSSSLIEFINGYKRINIKNKKSQIIYLSDEFYIMAKKELPGYRSYGRFLQIKNGIGKTIDFLNEFERSFKKYANDKNIKKMLKTDILIVTSEYGKEVFAKAFSIVEGLIPEAENKSGIYKKIKILPVKNNFLGGNVKVTGLLAGSDIIESLKSTDMDAYEKILIPECIFNSEGITIDNFGIKDFSGRKKDNIIICPEEGKELARKLLSG
ncbi:MAG: DUF512 domain-containing protein [Actinobacteria bacterium]|nr:DUF512 domain-containing protein [Actinomycetota bacterium]